MEKELNILILEDSKDDVSLIQRELKRGGVSAHCLVADTREDFEKALHHFNPDIVLSDHSMPMFNSFEALGIIKKHEELSKRRVPFILVTGTVSEEFAAQCIQAGADDYVLKDRLRRLPEAIRNALEKAGIENERKSFFEKVLANEADMKNAEQLAHFGTWKCDLETGRTTWSEGSYRIRGYDPGEIEPSLELYLQHIHPDDVQRIKEQIESMAGSGSVKESEFRIVTRNHQVRHVYSRMADQIVGPGKSVLVGFSMDITDRKLAESLLHEAYQIARIGGWEYDLKAKTLNWTDVTRELHEVPQDFVPSLAQSLNFYAEGDDRSTIQQAIQVAIAQGTPWDLELEIVTGKGNKRWIRDMGKADMRGGKCVRLFGSFQDIHERKKTQLQLQLQYQKLRQIGWTQSHEIRAPLARLIGLVNIFSKQTELKAAHAELFDMLIASAHELDAIIRKVVTITNEIDPEPDRSGGAM